MPKSGALSAAAAAAAEAAASSSHVVDYQLDKLECSVWSTIAGHAHPIDIYSPEIQDMIDVTDERLRTLYDAFDRDFDGRLSKPELLQGLAQQGFHNLAGTRAFELLWETCEKITTIAGEEEGGGASPSSAAVGGKKEENCITFAAFKRIVQRLKMELLFLPELHQHGTSIVGANGHYIYDSRAPTPVPFAGGSLGGGPGGAVAAPTASSAAPASAASMGPVLVAPAPRLFSGLGGGDHTVPTYASPGVTPPPPGMGLGAPGGAPVVGVPAAGGAVVVQVGAGRPLTPRGAGMGTLVPDYGTTAPGLPVEEYHHGQRGEMVVKFSSVDYNQKRYHAEVPVADTYAFFTAHRDPRDFVMRWLHLEGLDRLTILRFGVKYSLHPLCIEDALKLEDQQPKVNKYGNHFFVVMPFFRLTHESRKALDALRQQRRRNTSIIKSTAEAAASLTKGVGVGVGGGRFGGGGGEGGADGEGSWSDFQFRVEWSKLCLFVAGPPSFDTLISLHSKWELFNSETDEMLHTAGIFGSGVGGGKGPKASTGGGASRASASSPSCSLSEADSVLHGGYIPAGAYQGVAGGGGAARTHAFESLVSALRVEYSVLRQGDSRHLLYRILDEVVDYLIPIARAYRTRVRLFQAQLHRDESKFKKEQMRLVLGMKSELQRLQRRIRPMTAVVRHLMDDEQIGTEMKVYLEDVLDHVVRGLEEIGGCIEMCDSTKEEFKSLRDQRTNDVLYTLTIVTTLFVPLQFLTGVYGMNFTNRDGHPTMPELMWPHGYAFFWTCAGSLFLGSLWFFKFYKRWI